MASYSCRIENGGRSETLMAIIPGRENLALIKFTDNPESLLEV